MSQLTEAVGRALDQLAAAAANDGMSKPWLLAFTQQQTGVFLEAKDIELTSADDAALPLLALEVTGATEEVRARFLAAWSSLPALSDHEGRPVHASYEDAIGMGSNEAGEGWVWHRWEEID